MAKIVKADPGYEVLEAREVNDREAVESKDRVYETLHRHPVLAWRIDPDGVEPVTISLSRRDMERICDLTGIKFPDGRIKGQWRIFENEAAWLLQGIVQPEEML